jgi:hypothetical protein
VKNFDPRDTGTQKFVGSDRRLGRIKERMGSEDGSPLVRKRGRKTREDQLEEGSVGEEDQKK